MRLILSIIASLMLLSCGPAGLKEYKVEVVAEYPHDVESYTQGLFFQDGQMYESTGLHGKSTFRKVDLQTGEALEKIITFPFLKASLSGSSLTAVWHLRAKRSA